MSAVEAVEREVSKVMVQFSAWNDHTQRTIQDSIDQIMSLRQELDSLSNLAFVFFGFDLFD
jgi:hypothetical protein